MSKWLVILSIVAIGLAGCSRSLDVVVSFTAVPGLHKGDAVMLDGEQIGKVVELEHVDQRTRAVLALDPGKAISLRSNAAAMVVIQDSTHVVEIYNSTTGSGPLDSGHELLAIENHQGRGTQISVRRQDQVRVFRTVFRAELIDDWELARCQSPLKRIRPLV